MKDYPSPRIWPSEEILKAHEERGRQRVRAHQRKAQDAIDEALEAIYSPGVDQLYEALQRIEDPLILAEMLKALQRVLASVAWDMLTVKLRNPG